MGNRIKTYNQFLILEHYDTNLKNELIRLGVDDPEELQVQMKAMNSAL